MSRIFIVLIALCTVLIMSVSAGSMVSAISMNAQGTIASNSDTTYTGTNDIVSFSSSTFAISSMNYNSVVTDGMAARSVSNNNGMALLYDSMSAMNWKSPSVACNGQTCEETPGHMTATRAMSSVMLLGPGHVQSAAATNMYAVSAEGTGSFTYGVGVLDTQGVTSKSSGTEFKYSENMNVFGKFSADTMFRYTT